MRVVFQLARGIRPQRPPVPWLTDSLWEFIQHCWDLTPTARPSIQEVNYRINAFHRACVVPVPIDLNFHFPSLDIPSLDRYDAHTQEANRTGTSHRAYLDGYDADFEPSPSYFNLGHSSYPEWPQNYDTSLCLSSPDDLTPTANYLQGLTSTLGDQATYSDPFSIHTTVLPMLNLTLDQALVVDLPPCDNPLDYVHADLAHINTIVEDFTQNTDICLAKFTGDDLIYQVRCSRNLSWQNLTTTVDQRLIIYICTHLRFCTGDWRSSFPFFYHSEI